MGEVKENCFEKDSFDEQLACLEEELHQAQETLKTTQETLKTTESSISASEKQKKVIEVLISKRDQIIGNYRNAYLGLEAKQNEFKAIYDNEKSRLESLLTPKGTQRIHKIIADERNHISQLDIEINRDIEYLNGKVVDEPGKNKRKEIINKKNDLDKAKKDYELWSDPVKSIESRFKSLERIKKEIDKEHSAGNYAYAYYLLELLREDSFKYHLEGIPKVIDPDEIECELLKEWKKFQKADAVLNNITLEIKDLEKKLETNQRQFLEDNKNFEATIKRQINNQPDDGGSSGKESERSSESKLAVPSAASASKIAAESYQGGEKKIAIVNNDEIPNEKSKQ